MSIPSDLDIAQAATLKPLDDVARQRDLPLELLEMHGHDVAKIELDAIEAMADRPRAKYVVVTAMTSDAEVMSKPDSRGTPSIRPPRPVTMLRSARSLTSSTRRQVTRYGSSPAALPW